MNFSADIAEAKAELAQLNSALTTATGEREIAIRNQITAKENQLTTLYNLQASGGKIMSHFDF
jgi:hypothetical protein